MPCLAIYADVRLGSEKPLVALARLMHLRIALFLAVLGGGWRRDDRGIDDGAGGDAQALAGQVMVHRVQNLAAQFMLLQQTTEAKNRGLVRRRGTAQINTRKTTQHRRLVEGVLRAGIGKIQPLLQKIDAQHDRQPYRLTAVARLRIVRFQQRFQFAPRNHRVHHVQKLFPTALPCVLLKTRLRRQCPLKMGLPFHTWILFEQAVDRRLKQGFLKS